MVAGAIIFSPLDILILVLVICAIIHIRNVLKEPDDGK